MATVSGLFTSPEKGSGRSTAQDRVSAVAGHGLEGCAHAGRAKRQVLFASREHLDSVRVEPGAIRENVTVTGMDVQEWRVGQQVRAGEALFEITMVCDPCSRMDEIRPGLQAELDGRRGMLARVVESGEVAAGDEVQLL
jgi:MOSC domain-containing protein YiiM